MKTLALVVVPCLLAATVCIARRKGSAAPGSKRASPQG